MDRWPRRGAFTAFIAALLWAAIFTLGLAAIVRSDAVHIVGDPGFSGLSDIVQKSVQANIHALPILIVLSAILLLVCITIPFLFAVEHGREWPLRWLPAGTHLVAAILDRGDLFRDNGYATIVVRHVERVQGSASAVTFWYQVYELPLLSIVGDADGDTVQVKAGKNGSRTYQFMYV